MFKIIKIEYYDKFMNYLESCEIELIPGDLETQYINLVRTNNRSANAVYTDLIEKRYDIKTANDEQRWGE